jgi:hypothetical protein
MLERRIDMAPGSGIVDKYHQTDSGTPEDVKGIETLIHFQKFGFLKVINIF